MIARRITDTVGKTPMVELTRIGAGLPARIVVKLESRNPSGSVKDRVGIAMIEDAERRGLLTASSTLVEPTSGNTGIALAFAAASRGYRLVLVMPERMSRERIALLRYLGARVELTPGSLMRQAVERAEALVAQLPGAVMLQQFSNPANPEAHRRTTAVELLADTEGALDVFVAGVGTGGTITGVGDVLKRANPAARVIAVEPAAAAVLSRGKPGQHGIQGIGAGFVPDNLDRNVIDEVMTVEDDEAIGHARRLAAEEGILAGISSGANLAAALRVAARPELRGKTVATLVCDTGERYLGTTLFSGLVGEEG